MRMDKLVARRSLTEQKRIELNRHHATPSLYLTIDVEESFNWRNPTISRSKVSDIEDIKRFHLKCRATDISPVYLITYQMLLDTETTDFFAQKQRAGECELGIHLHAWNTPH